MNQDDFQDLLSSVREAGQILSGQREPSRTFHFPSPNVKDIRDRFGLTQENFARLLGISVATLRNWEQGRRVPRGPARVLLRVAERFPEEVWQAVATDQRKSA